MAAPDLRSLLHVGYDILTTTVNRATNKILAQLGDVHKQQTDTDNAEWWQHVGFVSRPPKPVAGKTAAQGVAIRAGDHDVVIASQDLRGLDLYGNLDHGETCTYAPGPEGTGQARIIHKKDGSINIYTTDTNTAAGQAVYLRVAPDGISIVAPWGSVKFDATGFHVVHAGGATLNLGGVSGLPSPLDVIASYFAVNAGAVKIEGSAQSFGSGTKDQLVKASDLRAILTSMIAAYSTAVGATPTNPVAIAAIATLGSTTTSS